MKKELVKKIIRHEDTGKTPYGIYFAADAQEMHFGELKGRFVSSELCSIVEKGILTVEDAISIGIGNHVLRIFAPWWDWFEVPDEYKKSLDAPCYLPKVVGCRSYTDFTEKLKFLSDHTDCYVLVAFYGSHFEKAYFARGLENFLADMVGNPEFSKRLLSSIIERNMVMIENVLYLPGVDGILLGSDWGSQKSMLMSPKVWRELIAPGEQREYDLIRQGGKDVWVHSCGSIEPIVPDLITMGLDVLNPVQPECMDIHALKDQFGRKLTFWGGISTQHTLPYGAPDEVRADTVEIIKFMSHGGGYITSPAQEIQSDVPIENIYALIETAQLMA